MTCGFRPLRPAARPGVAHRRGRLAGFGGGGREAHGLPDGTIGLKWPNDLVADGPEGEPLKLAGVLGEVAAAADGTVATCLVGLGINVDWPAAAFPPDLAPTDDQPP